jgi:hypothetical protein
MQAAAEARQSAGLKGKIMKRPHEISQSVGFYSALFAAKPAVIKSDSSIEGVR